MEASDFIMDDATLTVLIKQIVPWLEKAASGVRQLSSVAVWCDLCGASFAAKQWWESIAKAITNARKKGSTTCLLYTSPSPRDRG
eukprot:4562446-Amphidinium_carterae.1